MSRLVVAAVIAGLFLQLAWSIIYHARNEPAQALITRTRKAELMIIGQTLRRRDLVTLSCAFLVSAVLPATAAGEAITVLKTSGCACCLGWIKHLKRAGFVVDAKNVDMGTLMKTKLDAGLTAQLAACHTGILSGYIIEGHVPVREIRRLLDERPDAIGLAVPGMPLGSPGMEADKGEPYEVLLVRKGGSTEIFAQYR